ncbi:MAG: 2,3-bisphosphoglycerate-dependent phosphoglycerate mutase [Actinobacteria bacterium]|nr:2,3-bisphosphoglycerate-dependent phosphoglycerate mutase [Actinomycetota bacterium]MCG2800067.1 2,3-bisphosphoglycerate-dependent phosphoglycerate mutase [Cellulomonas sp.]
MTGTLVLLRHGESSGNALGVFTGWLDVPLSARGEAEATAAGRLLREAGVLPDVAHTSVLRRAIGTTLLTLDAANRLWVPLRTTWRLNERHYGALQGKSKEQIREEFGEERFATWRRSYAVRPPALDPSSPYAQDGDPRYAGEPVPHAECLADVPVRAMPYWHQVIEPDLRAGRTVLVVAHGNSIRALLKVLQGIGDDEIARVEVPTAAPLVFTPDEEQRLGPGRYLDPAAAQAAVERAHEAYGGPDGPR